jgi:hypothetical protein
VFCPALTREVAEPIVAERSGAVFSRLVPVSSFDRHNDDSASGSQCTETMSTFAIHLQSGDRFLKEHLVVDRVARLQNHMSSNLEWAHKRPVGHFREGGRLED